MSDKLRESINILWDRSCYKCGSYNCDMSCEAALAEQTVKESLTVAEQEPSPSSPLPPLERAPHD